MNPFEFVLGVLVMVFLFSLVKQRTRARQTWDEQQGDDAAETLRLRDEVKELKERIQVLERITVEKENSLARQIEELRDR
jgi:uncharacterized membrane protein